jgi:hypothetical protein
LAQKFSCNVLTTDYNLNRVAQIQGVRVLNVNELSNAIRPVVLPGEELTVRVVQPGKERNQGVGYLADGTMIVVENGDKLIGQEVVTEVTRVFQTVAGKMIFAAPKKGYAPVHTAPVAVTQAPVAEVPKHKPEPASAQPPAAKSDAHPDKNPDQNPDHNPDRSPNSRNRFNRNRKTQHGPQVGNAGSQPQPQSQPQPRPGSLEDRVIAAANRQPQPHDPQS